MTGLRICDDNAGLFGERRAPELLLEIQLGCCYAELLERLNGSAGVAELLCRAILCPRSRESMLF